MRPYTSPHAAISEMQMYTFTPPHALTSGDDAHARTHARTSVREDLSMRGLSVSMVTETGNILYVLGSLFNV